MDLSEKLTLKRRFKALDANGDGVLGLKELREMLTGGQKGMSHEDVKLLFKAVDKDRSGTVDFDEFVDFVFEPPLKGAAPAEWFDSAFSGDLDALMDLIKDGAEIDARDPRESARYPCSAFMTAAMLAAAEGRSTCLEQLIESSCNLHAQDTMLGKTAAMFAAEAGHRECLLLCAEAGASLEVGDINGTTPAMFCASQDQASCLRLLIKWRADLNARDAKGWTAAMHAARCGNAAALELIAKAGADLNKSNNDGQTAAIMAVHAEDELCVRILAMQGVNLFAKDHHGNTALMEAARMEHQPCARLLQRHTKKATRLGLMFANRVSHPDVSRTHGGVGDTAELFEAVWFGNEAKLASVLRGEDDVHEKAIDGWNVPMVAALRGHEACLQLLLEAQANLNERDIEGYTVTMLAAMKGHTSCLQILTEQRPDLDLLNDDGYTAGMLAASNGHATCLGLLGSLGSNLNFKADNGSSAALMFLLKKEQIFALDPAATDELCNSLLSEDMKKFAELSTENWRSETYSPPGTPAARSILLGDLEEGMSSTIQGPWFRAATNGIHKALSQLIKQRANVDAIDKHGMTAMMIAAELGDHMSLKILVGARGDANIKDLDFERTALSFCAEEGHVPAIRILIDEGDAMVDARDVAGRTPIMEAAWNGHEKVVRFLARRKATLDIHDHQMATPAALAAAQGHLECLRVLAEHGADLLVTNKDRSKSNVLHLIEQRYDLKTANSIVGDMDWHAAAAGGSSKLSAALQASASDKTSTAALHLNLWKLDEWGRLHIRDQGFTEVLFDCLHELLSSCMDRSLASGGKRILALLLGSGLLRAVKNELSPEHSTAVNELNSKVLKELEKALNERQEVLRRVSDLTEEPDVYFPRRDRNSVRVQSKLDQRDAMPQYLWKWLEELPDDCFMRLELAFRVFRMLDLAVSPSEFVTYLRSHNLHNDGALYAKAAAHILVGYAQIVEEHFEKYMVEIFGRRFKPAPVKKLPRIFTKMTGDVPDLADEARAAEHADLRCAYFALGDVVRGSVQADGAAEMMKTVERLQNLDAMSGIGRFDVWRIKNMHHERAEEMTGGYRDVKVLGRFRAKKKKSGAFKLPISMVVEIQVIDAVYLDIKQYMHKAYAIDRGDFD